MLYTHMLGSLCQTVGDGHSPEQGCLNNRYRSFQIPSLLCKDHYNSDLHDFKSRLQKTCFTQSLVFYVVVTKIAFLV